MTSSPRKRATDAKAWWRRLNGGAVARPRLTRKLDQWASRGGRLCLVGPRGSGRTRLLGSVLRALDHARRPYLLFCSTAMGGSDVRAALQALGQEPTVPRFPDLARRARHATVRIVREWRKRHGPGHMMVVVDDIHAVDALTRSVLAALMREPNVQMLAAGESAIDGLDTVEIEPLSADQSGLSNLGGTNPAVPLHMGDAILHSARSQGIVHGDGPWNATGLVDGLSEHARGLLHLITASVIPVPRASAGRLLGLDLASLARACSSLTNRGLVVEWGGGLRLASPVDAADLEELLGVQAELHQKASTLLGEDHPGQVPHAVVSPPRDLDGLEPAFDALLDWDPAGAARWGAVIVGRTPEPGLVRRTAEAAVADNRPDVAVEVLRASAVHAEDVYLRGAALALAGEVLLTTHDDTAGARRLLNEARSSFANNPHLPAELYLLEARLQLASQDAAQALESVRSARSSVPVFRRTARDAQELEGQILAAMGRLDDAEQLWSPLVRKADIATRERVAGLKADYLKKAQRLLDASNALVLLAHADRDVPDATQAKVLDKAALLALGGGDPGAAIAHWTASIELAEQLHATSLAARIRPRLAAVLREVCRDEEASAVVDVVWSDRSTPVRLRVECALIAGDIALSSGKQGEAERWYDEAARLVKPKHGASLQVRVDRRRVELDTIREHPLALERVTKVARAAHRARAVRDLARLHAIRGYLLACAQRADEVAPSLERAEAPLRDAGAGRLLAEIRIWAARAWLALGELDNARKVAAQAVVWAEETGHLRLRKAGQALLETASEQRGRPVERFDRMLDASTAIAREKEPARIFERVVEACAELLHAERAFCVMVDGESTRIAAAWREDGRTPGAPSRSVVRAVLGHGREIAVGDVEERAELRSRDSIVDTHVRSVICVPMFDQTVDGDRIIGVLYVDRHARSDQQVDQSLRILRALAAQTTVALAGARTLQEVEARARRAADMAHDLRSPAAALQVAGEELARSSEVPDWARDAGVLIATQAQRMVDLGNRYLADRSSEPVVFSLGTIAKEVRRVAAPLARASGRSVLVDVVQPVSVEAAEDDIHRVLQNLVQNGLRYTPAGTAVTIQVDRTPEGQACCRVMDAGDGVPEELLPRIFDRGVRSNSAGHGLGLSIALRLSERWGGELSVHNLDRQGACFTLTLPEVASMVALT